MSVVPGSPAVLAAIRPGDQWLAVGTVPVAAVKASVFRQATQKAQQSLPLKRMPDQAVREVFRVGVHKPADR